MFIIRFIWALITKKQYRVEKADEVEKRDVSAGLKHREMPDNAIITGKKAISHTQRLILKRRGEFKIITYFLKNKTEYLIINGKKEKRVTPIPKEKGNYIWI